MKINGLINKPRWYDIPCKCNHSSIETEYPIAECLHCKFEEAEKSLPKDNFVIKENDYDDDDNIINEHDRTVSEITIVRGKKYEEIIGWAW